MQGSPEVIQALNYVYQLQLPTEAQAHQQEHQLESDGYKDISNWFDKIEGEKKGQGHAVITHPLMKRINQLGGECDGRWAFQPDVARPVQQLDQAITSMVGRLTAIHQALLAAYEAGGRARDYVTCHCFLVEMMAWVERQLSKMADRQAKMGEMGVDNFLSEMFDKD